MAVVECVCPQCLVTFEAEAGAVNRARKVGSPKYCGRVCSGHARQKHKTADHRRAKKAEYDRARRDKLADRLKREKAEYYQRTKDPVKEAAIRKKRMPKHVEYCRRPEYRAWKKDYDKAFRAKKEFGEFWEAGILALEIRKTCLDLSDDTEIRRQKGTLNKKANRRKDYDRTHSNKPEIGALGYIAEP